MSAPKTFPHKIAITIEQDGVAPKVFTLPVTSKLIRVTVQIAERGLGKLLQLDPPMVAESNWGPDRDDPGLRLAVTTSKPARKRVSPSKLKVGDWFRHGPRDLLQVLRIKKSADFHYEIAAWSLRFQVTMNLSFYDGGLGGQKVLLVSRPDGVDQDDIKRKIKRHNNRGE